MPMRWNSSCCDESRRVERRNGRLGAARSVRSTRTGLSQRDKLHQRELEMHPSRVRHAKMYWQTRVASLSLFSPNRR
jgi:hypothetical protein